MTLAMGDGIRLSDGAKHDAIVRLKRVEGQMRGIQHMVEDDRYCVDVIRQLRSAAAAIGKLETLILHRHLETCFAWAIRSGNLSEQEEKIDEILNLLQQFGLRT